MSMHFGDESVGLSWDRQQQHQHQQQSHLSNRASAASDLEQEPEEVVLDSRRTFYVHDTLACPREEDPKEDQILFFHPAELPMMKQVALMDGIEGFSTFVKEFGMSPPKVITLEHEKAACMHVGQYTLSLCAPPEEPDTSLINQLHNLYSAFVFLHGSFDRVLKKAKNDKLKFREDIRNIWKRLTPLIRRTDTMSFTFQPVRFTELKRSANRHFIAASQILQMVKHRSGVLSGCIFFNKTILCSHLDPATTFWIHLLYDIIHPYASLGDVESTHQLMPVYLKKDIMTQLRVGARKTPEAKAGSTRIPEDFAPDEHGEYVGLYLQVLPRSTLVVVMELAAIYDLDLIHDMTESFVPRLKRLEEQVSKATEAGNV
ncbi:hypothetical protein, variant [Capsaspora owczarzaki ATCC 30864]|uniref:CCZ1/INTU/HSP4 first Longin domain-containing protein n=1 Tax=Capsaspora owczarzaki (strain ATCC 30864) TaxID=595528 RepID=A0A0D2UPM4_CAPO3|nr:hypothetical protein, variant [Capsaspora owczarzaki ATCC 30864]